MDDHTVIGRSLAVLTVVVDADPFPTSLAALTQRTGLPKPTVRRLAQQLTSRGILDKEPAGYRLGGAVETFGRLVAARRRDHDRVRPALLDLFAAIGGGVWIATCDTTGDLTLDDVLLGGGAAHGADRSWRPDGEDPSILASALAPLALPSHPDRLARLMARAPARLTPYTPTGARWFDDSVARAEEEGYAVEHEQVRVGWSCLAVPLPGGPDRRFLGVAMPVHRFRLRPVLRELQDTARTLAAAG
jgi:DNA-binding IclR family transcriptional regulator